MAIGMIRQASEQALKGVDGAFVMLPAVWAPSPDYKEAEGVIVNYLEALTKAAPLRMVALSSMGANRTSGVGMIRALSLLEQGFRDLISPIAPRRQKKPYEQVRPIPRERLAQLRASFLPQRLCWVVSRRSGSGQ
jgi:hypothetical protein